MNPLELTFLISNSEPKTYFKFIKSQTHFDKIQDQSQKPATQTLKLKQKHVFYAKWPLKSTILLDQSACFGHVIVFQLNKDESGQYYILTFEKPLPTHIQSYEINYK